MPVLHVWVGQKDELPVVTFESEFNLLDRVTIDGDSSLVAIITGFAFYGSRAEVQISYVHSGDIKSVWLIESRLAKVRR
jgi:hypothetical protein